MKLSLIFKNSSCFFMPSFSNIPSHQTTFPHGPLLVLKGTFFLLSLDKFRAS